MQGRLGSGHMAPPVTLSRWLCPAMPEGTVTSGCRVPVIPTGSAGTGRVGGWGRGAGGQWAPRGGTLGMGGSQAPAAPSPSPSGLCHEQLRDCISGRHFCSTASPWPGGSQPAPHPGASAGKLRHGVGGLAPGHKARLVWASPARRSQVEGAFPPIPSLCFG